MQSQPFDDLFSAAKRSGIPVTINIQVGNNCTQYTAPVQINQAAPVAPRCYICRRVGGDDMYRHSSGVDVHRRCVEIQEHKLLQLRAASFGPALMRLLE